MGQPFLESWCSLITFKRQTRSGSEIVDEMGNVVSGGLSSTGASNVVTATLGIGIAWIQWNKKIQKGEVISQTCMAGGHFLYKSTEQVYAKSNRDTFCYGPEALCLRASPKSSSEPRLYKNLCSKMGRCCKTSE